MDGRLPAHLEVSGLIRMVEAKGGFATVLAKGERDAGTLLILTIDSDRNACLYERMPQLDGARRFELVKTQDNENKQDFDEYLARRRRQDSDVWILELDIANGAQFIASLTG